MLPFFLRLTCMRLRHKPLRTGQIRTADEKLKDSIPQVSNKSIVPDWTSENSLKGQEESSNASHFPSVAQDSAASPKSDPPSSSEPIPPWLVTFKVPSHAQASIKFGNFVSTPPRSVTSSSDPLLKPLSLDPTSTRGRAKQKAEKRFAEGAGRLDRARESILDYQGGVHRQDGQSRPNPVSIRGWNALIEERIQVRFVLVYLNVGGVSHLLLHAHVVNLISVTESTSDRDV
jgi:DnaJ family protein C protein 28